MDSLLNKSKQVSEKVINNDIESETDSLTKQWSELENTMSSRIMLLIEVGEKWKNLEEEYRKIEIEFNLVRDGLINMDQVIRSKNQMIESLDILRVSLNSCTYL